MSGGDGEAGLRLATTLSWFWYLRVHWREACEWMGQLLAANGSAPASLQTRALFRAAEMQWFHSDNAGGPALARQALQLARAADDKWSLAWSLAALGLTVFDDSKSAVAALEEAEMLFREIGDLWGLSHTLRRLGFATMVLGQSDRAVALGEEALALARAAGDKHGLQHSLFLLGSVEFYRGTNLHRAATLMEESVSVARDIRDKNEVVGMLGLVGLAALDLGDEERARTSFEEGLILSQEIDNDGPVANCLFGLGILAWNPDSRTQAAKLMGKGEVQLEVKRFRYQIARRFLDSRIAEVRTHLNDGALALAWAEGRAMSLKQAVAYALQVLKSEQVETSPSTSFQGNANQSLMESLSESELKVLRLVAEGLSNAEIAQKLYLSVATIKVHVRNIFGKLGVSSRTQAVTQAQELNLL